MRYLVYFQFGALMNNAYEQSCRSLFVDICFHFFMGRHQKEWLGHLESSHLTLQETVKLLSKVASVFYSHQQYIKVQLLQILNNTYNFQS